MKSYTTSAVRHCVAFIISLAQKESHRQSACFCKKVLIKRNTKLFKRGNITNQLTVLNY